MIHELRPNPRVDCRCLSHRLNDVSQKLSALFLSPLCLASLVLLLDPSLEARECDLLVVHVQYGRHGLALTELFRLRIREFNKQRD